MKKVAIVVMFCMIGVFVAPLFGATTALPTDEAVTILEEFKVEDEAKVVEDEEPVPYEVEEFSSGLQKLRRAESIFFGAIPISALLVVIGTEATRQMYHAFDPPPITNQEMLNRAYYTLGVAAGIALFDFLLGQINESR